MDYYEKENNFKLDEIYFSILIDGLASFNLYEVAEKVFERRGMDFNQVEKDILTAVFEQTEGFRKY